MLHALAENLPAAEPSAPYTVDWKNPDYTPVIAARQAFLDHLRATGWEAIKKHYASSADGVVDFVEHWGWTFDPRNVGRSSPLMPFVLWPRQRKFLKWLHASWAERGNGLVEKTRDAGCSYLCVAFAVWLWAFHPGAVVGFGSRKEEYVDDLGDPKSLFWKVRHFIAHLPVELRGKDYDPRKHATFMRIVNPDTGSAIVGEAGDNIGRGNRTSIYFKDESAFYEHPDAIDAALSMTTDVEIDVSTPNGAGNAFYRKRKGGKIPVFVFDWRDDPRKDQAWYDKFKAEKGDIITAQEIDRNYEGSVVDAFIPGDLVEAAMHRGPSQVPAMGGLRVGIDVARFGNDRTVISFRKGRVLLKQLVLKKLDTMEVAARAHNAIAAYGKKPEQIAVDVIGIGAGVADALRAWYPDKVDKNGRVKERTVVDVTSSVPVDDGIHYNLRARMAGDVKEWLVTASIPNDPELKSDCTALRYKFKQGLIILESKEEAKLRGVRSPDQFDSLCLTFAVPTIPKPDRKPAEEEGMYVDGVM